MNASRRPAHLRRSDYIAAVVEALEPRILMDALDDIWSSVDDAFSSWTTDDSQSAYTQPADTQPVYDQPDNSGDNSQDYYTVPDCSYLPTTDDYYTPPPVYAPYAPRKLTAQALTTTSVYLTWQSNSNNADGYEIVRAGPDGNWNTVTTVDAATTHFTDRGLTSGTTYSYAVDAFNSGGFSNYSNVASVMTLDANDPTLVGQFGQLPGGSASAPLTFTDADGTRVTLTVSGPGAGVLHNTPSGFNITLAGTTLSSSFQISTSRTNLPGDDGRFSLAGLTVGNTSVALDRTGLGTLDARTTDLSGNLTITGPARQITLGNVTGEETLSIAAGLPNDATLTATNWSLGQVTDASLVSGTGIQSLSAMSWTAVGNPDQITAPYLNSLKITGRSASQTALAVQGDFMPSLLLNGPGTVSNRTILGSASIAGNVGASTWDIHGKVGTIKVAGATGSAGAPFTITDATNLSALTFGNVADIQITASGNLGSLNAGIITDGSLNIGGTINSIQAQSWIDGGISARTLNSLKIIGHAATKTNPAITGNLSADLNLSGPATTNGGRVLGSVSVANQILGGTWTVAGAVGSITAKAVASGWSAQITGSGGNISTITLSDAAATSDLEITANSLQTLTVKGTLADSHIALNQTVSRQRKALGSLSAGTIRQSEIRTAGNIGTVRVAALDHSLIFAGVQSGVSSLPASAGDFIDPLAANLPTISSLTLTGTTANPGGAVLIDSDIAAGAISRVSLPPRVSAVVDPDLAGLFGFATRIGDVKLYTGPASNGNFVAGYDSMII